METLFRKNRWCNRFFTPSIRKNCGRKFRLRLETLSTRNFRATRGEISRLPWLKVETELTSPPWSSTSARTRSASPDFRQRFSPPRFWHLNVSLSPSPTLFLSLLFVRVVQHFIKAMKRSLRLSRWRITRIRLMSFFFFFFIRKEIGRLEELKTKMEIED